MVAPDTAGLFSDANKASRTYVGEGLAQWEKPSGGVKPCNAATVGVSNTSCTHAIKDVNTVREAFNDNKVRHFGVRAAREANEVALNCPNAQLTVER
jgi:hypothetical protein